MKERGRLELYQRGADQLWTDEHISKYMLAAHLDTSNDAATRNPVSVDRTIDWIVAEAEGRKHAIDLGCGPGIYCERLAARGFEVTGLDLSARSIRHAKRSAEDRGLAIRYVEGSYLDTEGLDLGHHDMALCIYCDFGALLPAEQETFLRNVRGLLDEGGLLFLDVFSFGINEGRKEGKDWNCFPGESFWSPEPHLVLGETRHFPEARAWGTRTIVLEEGGAEREYITWDSYYAPEDLEALLSRNGFKVEGIKTGLVAKNDFASDDVLFVKARKN
jgi:SAM-dependent methyltransferase